MTRRAIGAWGAALLFASAVFGCDGRDTTRLKQENEALSADVRRLEREAADLRARLERTRNAIDLAQDNLEAAQGELDKLPDSAAEAADAAAAKLDEAAGALDDATDATDGADLTAPIMVRADLPVR